MKNGYRKGGPRISRVYGIIMAKGTQKEEESTYLFYKTIVVLKTNKKTHQRYVTFARSTETS